MLCVREFERKNIANSRSDSTDMYRGTSCHSHSPKTVVLKAHDLEMLTLTHISITRRGYLLFAESFWNLIHQFHGYCRLNRSNRPAYPPHHLHRVLESVSCFYSPRYSYSYWT